MKIGFANLDDSVPFAILVKDGIQQAASDCNVHLFIADNASNDETALKNAKSFVAQGVKGVLWFNYDGKIAPSICDTFKETPVITVSVPLSPCGLLVGDDDRTAGIQGGEGMGNRAKSQWNCNVDKIVTMENFQAGKTNTDRINGQIAGLQKVCPDLKYGNFESWAPTVPGSIITRENAFRLDTANQTFRDLLTANQSSHHIVVMCLNGPACQGAESAAQSAGRIKDVLLVSEGGGASDAVPSIQKDNSYVGTVNFYPQCYGALLIPGILEMLQGEKPTKTDIPTGFVDTSNLAQNFPTDKPQAYCPISIALN